MDTQNVTIEAGSRDSSLHTLYQNKTGFDVLTRITNHSNTSPRLFNDSYDDIQMIPEAPSYIVVTATIFYVMIFLVGIFGNLLVIAVVCLSTAMKTSVNMYVINLCVADILVLLVCMPTALAEIYTKEAWYFGPLMCK